MEIDTLAHLWIIMELFGLFEREIKEGREESIRVELSNDLETFVKLGMVHTGFFVWIST